MKKIILIIIIVITLSSCLFPKLYKVNKIDIDNQGSVVNNILQLKDYSSIHIVKEKKYKDFYAILYYPLNSNTDNSEENLELVIYKKISHSDDYSYYGGASSTKTFDTFNCNEKGQETMIVVYGDNRLLNAFSYCIKCSQNQYKKDIESDFVLDIYVIDDTDNCSTTNELLDSHGVLIEMF